MRVLVAFVLFTCCQGHPEEKVDIVYHHRHRHRGIGALLQGSHAHSLVAERNGDILRLQHQLRLEEHEKAQLLAQKELVRKAAMNLTNDLGETVVVASSQLAEKNKELAMLMIGFQDRDELLQRDESAVSDWEQRHHILAQGSIELAQVVANSRDQSKDNVQDIERLTSVDYRLAQLVADTRAQLAGKDREIEKLKVQIQDLEMFDRYQQELKLSRLKQHDSDQSVVKSREQEVLKDVEIRKLTARLHELKQIQKQNSKMTSQKLDRDERELAMLRSQQLESDKLLASPNAKLMQVEASLASDRALLSTDDAALAAAVRQSYTAESELATAQQKLKSLRQSKTKH